MKSPSAFKHHCSVQDNGQAQMEERLMMQQQQMEDDQRWLEQEESFMVEYKHFLLSLLKAGGQLHKIWQLKSNIYMWFGP